MLRNFQLSMFFLVLKNSFQYFREVVLGEHILNVDPDCQPQCNAKKITRGIAEIIVHENFNGIDSKNDIALIRLNDSVPLFDENFKLSSATPVCLPWSEGDPGRLLEESDSAMVSGWGKFRTFNRNFTKRFLRRHKTNSKILRKLQVEIANEKCTSDNPVSIDPQIQLCAGGDKGLFHVSKKI